MILPKTIPLDIGSQIDKYLKVHGLKRDDVSKQLGYSVTNSLAKKLNKKHYGTVFDLIEISLLLDHNFFTDIVAYLNKSLPDSANSVMEPSGQIEYLQNKIADQAKLITTQEKLIARMETMK